jgi:hypothetical protein
MNPNQPYVARIHVSGDVTTEMLEATSSGAPVPHVERDGITYFYTGGSGAGQQMAYDYTAPESA